MENNHNRKLIGSIKDKTFGSDDLYMQDEKVDAFIKIVKEEADEQDIPEEASEPVCQILNGIKQLEVVLKGATGEELQFLRAFKAAIEYVKNKAEDHTDEESFYEEVKRMDKENCNEGIRNLGL